MCDSAAWLEHGSLKMTGPAGQVIRGYLDHVTQHRGVAVPPPAPDPLIPVAPDTAVPAP